MRTIECLRTPEVDVDIFSVVPIEGIDHRRLVELRNRFTGNRLSHDDWLDIVLILDKLIDYRAPKSVGR